MKFTLKTLPLLCATALSLPCSVFAAHPLNTEDTGTQGRGNFQLEVNFEHSHQDYNDSHSNSTIKAATLSYGLNDDIDIMFTLPHTDATSVEADEHVHNHGYNDRALDLKWRFYEEDGVSFALKPEITFPTGDHNQGLGEGKHTYALAIINTIELNPWQINWHVNYRRNHNLEGEREHLWHYSVSALRQFGDTLRLVVDVGSDTAPVKTDNHDTHYIVLGAIYSPSTRFDLDVGIRKEINGAAISHTFMAGVAVRW